VAHNIHQAHLDDPRQFAGLREFFEADNPGLRLSRVEVQGETELHSEHGGMRVFWIYRGTGEVFLPRGFRTQEGDGAPLPAEYGTEPIPADFAETLHCLHAHRAAIAAAPYVAASAIFKRCKDGRFSGDIAGELWKLDHLARPWAKDATLQAAMESLWQCYREIGWATKQADSWEPLMAGDQLIAAGSDTVRVRGDFACLAMENTHRPASHVPAVRRLRYLADTAGGCNPDFDPFRRLPLTWFYNYPGETGDGLNWVNSHVVNIPKETSPSHFHPPKSPGGTAIPQREMYLVLDPKDYQLNTWGRTASLVLFPDLRDLAQCQQIPLEPGRFVYIPPGVGHRGLDAFVNVLTIPGFKPWNEYYIDRDIQEAAGGQAPFNENLCHLKNFQRIEDLL
jgi:hypothetical protein